MVQHQTLFNAYELNEKTSFCSLLQNVSGQNSVQVGSFTFGGSLGYDP